jgi:hypothetical protein
MTPRRLRLTVLAAGLTVVVALGITAVWLMSRSVVTELPPERISTLGEGGDPLVIMIGVPWREDGYCTGQFTVTATESAAEIRVSTVQSRAKGSGTCAEVGTEDNFAWAPLHLQIPLGGRSVLRASDGKLLPVTGR